MAVNRARNPDPFGGEYFDEFRAALEHAAIERADRMKRVRQLIDAVVAGAVVIGIVAFSFWMNSHWL